VPQEIVDSRINDWKTTTLIAVSDRG